ncbi:hypothetical protein HPB50_004354 [Hyalomma asiaticum]|uniref:Uncharacterized protein n=1 Tax=Hyalomma asiaticum TaxID=266040 RepID=A0ACB7TAG8_HYAAI|nr:hypothetical protein HPB50_004354 [Hyalomma asiaticum]
MSSEALFSEDFEHILSTWKRSAQIREMLERRDRAFAARERQPVYGAAPLPASPREAALRRPPPYRHVAWPLTPKGTSSTECSEEGSDTSEVPVTTSLCYAALILFTALLALSAGLVLFRLVPNTNENSRSHSLAQGLRANSGNSYRHHLCDVVFYTHCPRTAHEFYFSGATNSCVRATASYGTEVCNRSPNKFASRASCLKSCVHASRPSGRCLDRPVFSQCRSADLKRQLWFFEGETCQPWDFPSGKCPMADGDLFGSREDCVHKCLKNETYLSLCRTPPSGTCTTHHLKYPYFAIAPPGAPKMVCLKTSSLGLRRQLCLTGTNRFPTIGLRAVESSRCDISARMHCLTERSKIGQTVTGKYANAMRVSNSIAAATAHARSKPAANCSKGRRRERSCRSQHARKKRARRCRLGFHRALLSHPTSTVTLSDESYVAPSGQ